MASRLGNCYLVSTGSRGGWEADGIEGAPLSEFGDQAGLRTNLPVGDKRNGDGRPRVSKVAAESQDRLLQTVVIALPFTNAHLARLRSRFPDTDFRVVEPSDVGEAIADADAVATWQLAPEHVERAPHLRWFQTGGAGVEGILHPILIERGVLLTNASGVHAINIAEHVMAMMLYFARGFPALIRNQIRREWNGEVVRPAVSELQEQRLLVVGLGEIGAALAGRTSAFGMEGLGVRRRANQPAPMGVHRIGTIDDLPELLPLADHVAICLPLTSRTAGLFDRRLLAAMRPSAYLYNIGRGAVVRTEDLVVALQGGGIAGAGLDVTDPEPLPATSPLWAMENVIITAHTSGGTPRYWDRPLDLFEDNIDRYLNGRPLRNIVDVTEGY